MAFNDVDVTVAGWVGNDPRYYPGQDGQVPFTQLRLARTRRSLDRERNVYVDAGTDWFTVKVFRDVATNVSEALRRGDPVVVHGRLHLEEWTGGDGSERITPTIVATALGHNLALGTSRFVRTIRGSGGGAAGGPAGAGGPGAARDGGAHLPPDPLGEEHLARVDLTGAVLLDDDPEDAVDVREVDVPA
jgi:single-strand DNA-binding protein